LFSHSGLSRVKTKDLEDLVTALIQMLKWAVPMHDTGKIGIPDEIPKAPRKLTEREWEIIKNYSQIGYDILSQSNHPIYTLAEVALAHHEKWDGSGYPLTLAGEEISQAARIVAIADVFDALTMVRPYKKAWPIKDAFK
jgi:putative two-component system response regulator